LSSPHLPLLSEHLLHSPIIDLHLLPLSRWFIHSIHANV
jgi:hypothetical protein